MIETVSEYFCAFHKYKCKNGEKYICSGIPLRLNLLPSNITYVVDTVRQDFEARYYEITSLFMKLIGEFFIVKVEL